jgi:hypothetical protein
MSAVQQISSIGAREPEKNTVVPAQAGTHEHKPVIMGPRLRGDDRRKAVTLG